MSEQQIGELAEALVKYQSHFDAMPSDDRQWVIQNTKDAIALFVEAVRQDRISKKAVETNKLLEFVSTNEIAAIASFVAKEKFRERDTTDDVKIASLSDNFKSNFLGKKETDIASATLRIQKLRESSRDELILAALGEAAETELAQFWELLKSQGSGQYGMLLLNGWANIAYIRDEKDKLWAVGVRWLADFNGWVVEAWSVESPRKWLVGNQVVSR
jgi:hypothetical protein